jgi:heme exporter protein B
MSWSAKALLLVRKELRIEFRARDTLPPMVVFAAAVVLLLALSAPGSAIVPLDRPAAPGTLPASDVLPAFLWITVLFAGLIGFSRGFESERNNGTLDVLLLLPVDRSAVFVAKAAANLLFLLVVEIVLIPLAAIFFSIDLGASWAQLALIALLLDIGFVGAGTLLAAVASTTRNRELMLPILALPLLVPPFLAALELSSDVLLGAGMGTVAGRGWFVLLVAYDVVVITAGVMSFEFAIE